RAEGADDGEVRQHGHAGEVQRQEDQHHPGEAAPVLGDDDGHELALLAAAQQLADLRPGRQRLLDLRELAAHRARTSVVTSRSVDSVASATLLSKALISASRSATRVAICWSLTRMAAMSSGVNSTASLPPTSLWASSRKSMSLCSPTWTTCGSRSAIDSSLSSRSCWKR